MLYILIILIFIRPFICALAFPYLNLIYSSILLFFLFVWFSFKRFPLNKIKTIKFPLILFILALIISVIFSFEKIKSLKELYKYVISLLIFLAGISLSDEEKLKVIYSIILAGFVISVLAIYQYFFGFQYMASYIAKKGIASALAIDYISQRRVFFPFVTPNILAGYLILIIPLVLILKDRSKWVILPVMSVALLFTKSLGAFLSLFLGLGLYLYLRKVLPRKEFAFIVIIEICFVSIFILRQTMTKEYLLPVFSFARRLGYWRDALKIIRAYPLVGVGIGNFNLPLSRYAHNFLLQIWAEMGILGLVSFAWIVGATLISCFKKLKSSTYKSKIIGFLTANVIFLIHNFFDFTFFLPEVVLIWWIVLGSILFKENEDDNRNPDL